MLRRFGEVLAEQTVGVLVGAAFPGVVWRREVEAHAGRSLERGVVVELGPLVHRDGPHAVRLGVDQLSGAGVDVRRWRSLPSTT